MKRSLIVPPIGFDLIESGISAKGVIVAEYLRSGDVRTGSFGQEVPSEAERSRRKTLSRDAA